MLAASAGAIGNAWAVQGGVVAAGNGTINTQGNKTTISQTSDKMVVNWNSFDIGKKESVTINQPGATSAVLNRVTTAAPTQIDGSLTANGRVFVVNPAGVMFGKSAKVDVGSLVASTLDTDDRQFMDGGKAYLGGKALNLHGNGISNGTVANEGDLNAREAVVMVGANAINRGTIHAKDVTLAAADGVAMQMGDSGFSVMLGRAAQNALAANYGAITANGGDVQLSAAATGAMLATVVKNTGTVEATRATTGQGGSIILGSELDGKISAGGRMTADQSISMTSSPVIYLYPPFDANTQPRSAFYGSTGHDITVEAGAKLSATRGNVGIETAGGGVAMNGRIDADSVSIGGLGGSPTTSNGAISATNSVSINSSDSPVIVNGKISGRTASLFGAGVTVNAPVSGTDQVLIRGDYGWKAGAVEQNADVKSTNGSVMVTGTSIYQANGVKTVAGDNVKLSSLKTAVSYGQTVVGGGDVRAADISARTVDIVGGRVNLAGNVKADGDVNVRAIGLLSPCVGDDSASCAAMPALHGTAIFQRGNVISRDGSVTMTAGEILQDASTKTRAGEDVTLTAGGVKAGAIRAGDKIEIDSRSVYLAGKLKAREIVLPERTFNTEGNVRIKPAATDL